ncbi:MAG: ABC transporter ATP-binding protein [Lachnospiraceae bacterium]
MSNEVLVVENLSKKYGSVEALKDISFSVEKGKIVGLLGPNGSGKSTLIKLANGLLEPSGGSIRICGNQVGIATKKVVSYLPERTYLNNWMRVEQIIAFFADFYQDFSKEKAYDMLERLHIDPKVKLSHLSKGNREKVQLILVMSRESKLYFLDEPIGGVDPAARDYILQTIIGNYNPDASVILSTHLISDVENILDEAVFIKDGTLFMKKDVEEIRSEEGKSLDALFREVFKC